MTGRGNKTGTSKGSAVSNAQKAQAFKKVQESIFKKLRKQFRDTQRVPFMLDNTRKPLFPQLEKKFFLGKKFKFFSFRKSRIVPTTLRSPLCSQNVSFLVKVQGFDKNKLEKSRIVTKKRLS